MNGEAARGPPLEITANRIPKVTARRRADAMEDEPDAWTKQADEGTEKFLQ